MRYASILFRHYRENGLFVAGAGENNGEFFLPFAKIRTLFLEHGIELNTPDVNAGRAVLFELHINVQRRAPSRPGYVYLYENALVRPRNEDQRALQPYRKIFTWNTTLARELGAARTQPSPRAVILPYPNRIETSPTPAFHDRPHGCVLVASNKSLPIHDPRDLYQRRLQVVRAFESTVPAGFFSLYGRGWEYPAARPGKLGKLFASLRKRFKPPAQPPFPSWRGPIADKDALLRQSKFAICYENGADIPGYISEKIFDCFRAGCVPVYWGPQAIADDIPRDCFIDARAFPNEQALVVHVVSLGEKAHAAYQAAMVNFLCSPAAARFSEDHFAHTLVNEITTDLRNH